MATHFAAARLQEPRCPGIRPWVAVRRSGALPPDARLLQHQQHAAAGVSGAAGRTARQRGAACSAATEQNRGSAPGGSSGGAARGSGGGGSSSSWGSSSGPLLLLRISRCSTAHELHQLLLTHAAELRGREVAAALEVTAKNKLLETDASGNGTSSGSQSGSTSDGSQSGSTSGSNRGSGGDNSGGALGALLVQLAAAHAPSMDPACLSGSAWALAVANLQAARPVMRSMHELAVQQLVQYSPSQLCSLLWAGGSLDPRYHSPLLPALSDLLGQGMSLEVFSSNDLAVLTWLCGREGGDTAKEIVRKVAAECRSRIELYTAALQLAEEEQYAAAGGGTGSSGHVWVEDQDLVERGVKWSYTMPTTACEHMFGVHLPGRASKFQSQIIKAAVAQATRGEVVGQLELLVCSTRELNPHVFPRTAVTRGNSAGKPIDWPLEHFDGFKGANVVVWQALSGLGRLRDCAASSGGSSIFQASMPGTQALLLSAGQVAALQQECAAAAGFWDVLTMEGVHTKASKAAAASSFAAIATTATGRRLLLTWRRQQQRLLPVEVEELPPDAAASASSQQQPCGTEGGSSSGMSSAARQQQWHQQRRRQQAAQPPLLPPPFGPRAAAMLLTGLAQLKHRTPGLVEPLLRQCGPALGSAQGEDVARILVALGDLQMDIATELLTLLVSCVARVAAELAPRQMAAVLRACSTFERNTRLGPIGVRHFCARVAEYSAADIVSMLWVFATWRTLVPDPALLQALQQVRPELQQLPTPALNNLVWALGKLAGLKRRHEWHALPAGATAVAVSAAALAELARRSPGMLASDLCCAVHALAVHGPDTLKGLPPPAVAALRRAAAAAAAENDFAAHEVAELATAAVQLRWVDPAFTNALAEAIRCRIHASTCTNEVYCRVVRALASLAPAHHGQLFDRLALAYASKHSGVAVGSEPAVHFVMYDADERTMLLDAFATVAQVQALPRDSLLALLASASGLGGKRMPLAAAASLVCLAGLAQADPYAPEVDACCRIVRNNIGKLSLQSLRQAYSGLTLLQRQDAAPALADILRRVDYLLAAGRS